MLTTKTKISVTIDPRLALFLDEEAHLSQQSKSTLVEKALKDLREKKLEEDVKMLANLSFSDLPNEDEWLQIQPPID